MRYTKLLERYNCSGNSVLEAGAAVLLAMASEAGKEMTIFVSYPMLL